MQPAASTRTVEITPGLCGGRPHLSGSRILVQDLVVALERGASTDDLTDQFPQLSAADVAAAVAYYHEHRPLMDRQIQEEQLTVARVRAFSGRPTAAPAERPNRPR